MKPHIESKSKYLNTCCKHFRNKKKPFLIELNVRVNSVIIDIDIKLLLKENFL